MAKSSYVARNGHGRTRTTRASMNGAATSRRLGVIQRLEKQLKDGIKPQTNHQSMNVLAKTNGLHGYVPLTDNDRKRIETELTTLKSRV